MTQLAGTILQAIGWAFLPALLLPFAVLFLHSLRPFAVTLTSTIDALNRTLGEAVKWLLPILVLTVVFTVFALSIFGWASPKLDESAIYLHATIIMLGSSAALLSDEHVRVDVLYSRFEPTTRSLVDFCGFYLLLAPIMLTILWKSQSFTAFSWNVLEGSPDADGIPAQFLLKTLIPAFALLMLTQGLSIATKAALAMRSHDAA